MLVFTSHHPYFLNGNTQTFSCLPELPQVLRIPVLDIFSTGIHGGEAAMNAKISVTNFANSKICDAFSCPLDFFVMSLVVQEYFLAI